MGATGKEEAASVQKENSKEAAVHQGWSAVDEPAPMEEPLQAEEPPTGKADGIEIIIRRR